MEIPSGWLITSGTFLPMRPEAVAQVEFLEWTDANHLRHTKFVGLRGDKDPNEIVRET